MSGIRRWTQLLFLLLGVDTAQLQTFGHLYRNAGNTVNLPFKMLPDDPGCVSTKWVHTGEDTKSVTVAQHGKIEYSELNPSRANRMILESNCSLTVKDIRAEDVGLYAGQQPNNGKQRQIQSIWLSVLEVSDVTRGDSSGTEQTLNCSLFVLNVRCIFHNVSWLNEEGSVINSSSECSATLTKHLMTKKKFRCQVTVNGEVKTFIDVLPASHHEEASRVITMATVVVLVVVVIATVLVIFFAVKRKTTPSRNKSLNSTNESTATVTRTRLSANQIDPDGGLTYVSVIHTNRTKASVGGARAHDDRVTYATVKHGSANDLYVKGNKSTSK